ncbi:CBS domain-containing protein [Paenibacillus sp. GD4]|jgi:CBS domain-containing protein|uniref:CBS domain-containing protein n=1 Tax=Paenibacillus TaxID=44249 RepID=UPI002543B440|nr:MULTISPECIES: CBS domain-containing protein [Paenibacillus]MDQ1913152.1 CBS domain-containing protein [Paenibacillus sp. GD4]
MNTKKLRDIMTTDCSTVTLKDNVYEVAVKMKKEDTGFIPVVDENKKLIGCITDRDIVLRGIAEKREGSAKVEQVMSDNLVCASPETTVDEAAKLMAQHQIRRLPITENEKLVGIVSIGDLAVRDKFEDEAGQALSKISEQDQVTVH